MTKAAKEHQRNLPIRGSQFSKPLIEEPFWCSEHWCFEGHRSCLSVISRGVRIIYIMPVKTYIQDVTSTSLTVHDVIQKQ